MITNSARTVFGDPDCEDTVDGSAFAGCRAARALISVCCARRRGAYDGFAQGMSFQRMRGLAALNTEVMTGVDPTHVPRRTPSSTRVRAAMLLARDCSRSTRR